MARRVQHSTSRGADLRRLFATAAVVIARPNLGDDRWDTELALVDAGRPATVDRLD